MSAFDHPACIHAEEIAKRVVGEIEAWLRRNTRFEFHAPFRVNRTLTVDGFGAVIRADGHFCGVWSLEVEIIEMPGDKRGFVVRFYAVPEQRFWPGWRRSALAECSADIFCADDETRQRNIHNYFDYAGAPFEMALKDRA